VKTKNLDTCCEQVEEGRTAIIAASCPASTVTIYMTLGTPGVRNEILQAGSFL
jgi:hypothetical protein